MSPVTWMRTFVSTVGAGTYPRSTSVRSNKLPI